MEKEEKEKMIESEEVVPVDQEPSQVSAEEEPAVEAEVTEDVPVVEEESGPNVLSEMDATNEEVPEGEGEETELISAEAPETVSPMDDSISKLAKTVNEFMPEADTSTPEAVLSSLVPLVEDIVAFSKDLTEVDEQFPEFGELLIYLRKGYSPEEAIAMSFDIESISPPEGAPNYEGVLKAKESRKKAMEEKRQRAERVKSNLAETKKMIDEYAEEKGWDEEQKSSTMGRFEAIVTDLVDDGRISRENFDMVVNGLNYSSDIQAAKEDAEIAGRNAQIEKKRITKETGD